MTSVEIQQFRNTIHWALIRNRGELMEGGKDEEGHVVNQALFCPAYATLSGSWGSDWGAIMCPSSEKFGQLVFEHEWCGHTYHPHNEKVWTKVLA